MNLRVGSVRERSEALRTALESIPWIPYRRGFGLQSSRVVEATASAMEDVAGEGATGARALAVFRNDRIVGGVTIARQRFEADIYGLPVARSAFAFVGPGEEGGAIIADTLLEACLATCAEWSCDHWSLLAPADDAHLVQAAVRRGWLLADSTLDFTWDLRREATRTGRCSDGVAIRMARPDDADTLSEMASRTYTTSIPTRYVNDPRLRLEDTGRLYAAWARNACLGSFADAVAVAELDGRIVGFDMLKLDPLLSERLGVGVGRKGIAAVESSARGQGITSCLEAHLNRWQWAEQGRFNSGRVLFNNIAMQHALAKVGGVVTAAFHTFHVWPGTPDSGAAARTDPGS